MFKQSVLAIAAVCALCSCGGQQTANTEATATDSITEVSTSKAITAPIEGTVYTDATGTSAYSGEAQDIEAIVNGHNLGKVGQIAADGKFSITLPQVPDSILMSRPDSDVKGATLDFNPNILPMKNAEDYVVIVYVSKDFPENGTTYPAGWSFASIQTHTYMESIDGYNWTFKKD